MERDSMRMMKPRLQLSAAWLLLPLLLHSARALANGSAAFRSARVCPASPGPANVTGLWNQRACAIECAARPDCVAAAHSPVDATCRLADTGQFVQGWRSSAVSGCRSDVSAQRLMTGGVKASALTSGTRAALLAFHNFLLGTPNLAGNASFAASLGPGARLTEAGVWLDGSDTSYIEIDTESGNLTKFFGYGSQFTYFAKYTRAWQPGQTMMFIQLITDRNHWYEFRNRDSDLLTTVTVAALQFGPNVTQERSHRFNLLPVGDSIPLFTAVTFNQSAFTKFYWNRTLYPASAVISDNFTSGQSGSSKLRLGRLNSNTGFNMRGVFICWGAAVGILSAAQLEEINQLC